MRQKAQEYGVSARLLANIITCESQWNPSIQSKHRYHSGNTPRGYAPGDREQSYGLVQIHLPAHTHITKEQAIDPEFSIDFLARNVAAGRASMWSCYKTVAKL